MTKVRSSAIEIQRKYKKVKQQLKDSKKSLSKEVEEKARLIEQIKGLTTQVAQQKETLEQLSKKQPATDQTSVQDADKMKSANDALQQKIKELQSKLDESMLLRDKTGREKTALEAEIAELKTKLANSKEDINVLYSNLQECITNFQNFKKQLEAKIEREVTLETNIASLKAELEKSEMRTANAIKEASDLRVIADQAKMSVEELKRKIVSSDDVAFVFSVTKETIFGKEDLLVS